MTFTGPSRALASALAVLVLSACPSNRKASPADPPLDRDGLGTCPLPRCSAQPGDLVEATLAELLPTQGSLGYDEVYYRLGRYRSRKDELAGGYNRRFEDWCESNGQEKVAGVSDAPRLDDPATFRCTIAVGSETPATVGPMKSAIVGPRGQLFLTDGHHTFTSFWEADDGGPQVRIRVRIQANFSRLTTEQFWREMEARQWVWLYDKDDRPIDPANLPRALGLRNFGNDPYRGMIYFARDIGYQQLPEIATFQEFFWGRWLRKSVEPALAISRYDLDDLASYLALVKATSQAMAGLADEDTVSGGKTAVDAGKLARWNNGSAEMTGAFGRLSKPLSDPKPGKLAFALAYKAGLRPKTQ